MNIRLAAAADVTTSVTRWHDHFSIFSFIQPGNICPIPLPIINIAKVGSKYCQNPKFYLRFLKVYPSGEILPNLVTLLGQQVDKFNGLKIPLTREPSAMPESRSGWSNYQAQRLVQDVEIIFLHLQRSQFTYNVVYFLEKNVQKGWRINQSYKFDEEKLQPL